MGDRAQGHLLWPEQCQGRRTYTPEINPEASEGWGCPGRDLASSQVANASNLRLRNEARQTPLTQWPSPCLRPRYQGEDGNPLPILSLKGQHWGKGFRGRILTCPHPLGPRTSSQSFLRSGLGWRQSRWLSGPRRAVPGALGHTLLSAKASPAFTAKHASAWIRRNRELNRGFGGDTGGGGVSWRHLAKSNGSQAPGVGCGFRATQTQLL